MRSLVTIICSVSLATACASTDELRLVAAQDVVVTTKGGKETRVRKGEALGVAEPAQVAAPGYVSLFLVPLESVTGTLDVNLRPIDAWGGEAVERQANARLSTIVGGVIEAQRLIAQRQPDAALTVVTGLLEKNPGVTYLQFLRASCLVLLDRKPQALEALAVALHEFPDNAGGRQLYKSLAGKDYEGAPAH